MNALISFIPFTVFVAVFLFFLKELIEGIRRYRGEGRKKKVLRALLARECELNNWTIKSIKRIVETIQDEAELSESTEFMLVFPKSGKVFFRVKKVGKEFKNGSSLGDIHRETMSKNLLEIAMLDKELFKVLQPAYDAISDLEHVRNSLIYYIDPEDDQDQMHLESFTSYAVKILKDIYKKLNDLYVECNGTELVGHRLR